MLRLLKRVGVEDKIEPPVCRHFYHGISKAMGNKVMCECISGKCRKDDTCEFIIKVNV